MPEKRDPISLLYREQPPWRWIDDSWQERADAWMWRQRWIEYAIGFGLCFAAGFLVAWWLGHD